MFIEALTMGFETVFQLSSIIAIIFGVAWGVLGGMIPGISATIAMALLLPFTWGMDPEVAVMMLAGVYCGGEYGGSIPAILLGTPGTNAAACTVLDGYQLHKKGKTGLALYVSLISSCFGGLVGAVILIGLAIPLARVALAFGPSEYFALATVGLTLVCSLGEKSVLKGLLAGLLGVLISTVGFDPFVGTSRFSFGIPSLLGGFKMVPLMMGLFALSEMLKQSTNPHGALGESDAKPDTSFPKWNEIKKLFPFNLAASIIGVVVGSMPGAGATAASFLSYSEAKRWSKEPETFGKGNVVGIAMPESANNAVTGGAMIPLLSLGIPGSNSTAIMLGALMIHNIAPGPMLFTNHPEVPYGIFIALFVANIFMFFIGMGFIKVAMKITNISKPVLIAVIIALVFTGAYAYSLEISSIFIALCFGVLGLILKRFGVPNSAVVLGFVLGFIMEANLRRALIVSEGSYGGVITNSSISMVLLGLALLSVVSTIWRNYKEKKKGTANAA